MKIREIVFVLFWIFFFGSCKDNQPIVAKLREHPQTFCNPLNLNYRFMVIEKGDGIREAADPVVVNFQDTYFLFASKSSGYWHSEDMNQWTHVFITDSVLPIEDYAPGIFIHGGYVYYVGSTHGQGMLYRSDNPKTGKWEKVKEIWSYWDPAFYVEGDTLYMYYGCSPKDPIYAQALDLNTLEERSPVITCFNSDIDQHGWERTGEQNELPRRPYIEGAWMTKHNGKYYLQYAAPGTEWKSYADGTYVADSPIGLFKYAANNPVSYKPTGFMGGAGHGCLFRVGENYWKAATNSISVRHLFERRISFYPIYFDKDDYLYSDTYLGDYPMYLPSANCSKAQDTRPDWMLLSYGKPVSVSSERDGYPAGNLADEDARTAWVANGNSDAEWVCIDLKQTAQISAIQVNYDEYGATQKGMNPSIYQSYLIYASNDGETWYTVVDKSLKKTDTPHDYLEFESPFRARYIKWANKEYTVSGQVSLRELRVFGYGAGQEPEAVDKLTVVRHPEDACKASVRWSPVFGAEGYIVRYGIDPGKLYNNFQVMRDTVLEIGSLDKATPYYFSIDAFNANGLNKGTTVFQ